MKVKVVKTADDNEKHVLNICFNANGQAVVGDHSPEESEKIIREFIETTPNVVGKCDAITISNNNDEPTYGESTWKGQKFILDNGTLKLQNDIDPVIDIKSGSLLIYDGYTVNLSEQQMKNIKAASEAEDVKIAFDDCYFNEMIEIGDVSVGIDKGVFDDLVFENSQELEGLTENRSIMTITDGTRIGDMIVGRMNHVNVNCEVCSGDEDPVVIETLEVRGSASLYNCHISQLGIGSGATVDICCEVDNVCVNGTAYIGEDASIETIHVHAGGKITGHLDGIEITCDRAFRLHNEEGRVWIVG